MVSVDVKRHVYFTVCDRPRRYTGGHAVGSDRSVVGRWRAAGGAAGVASGRQREGQSYEYTCPNLTQVCRHSLPHFSVYIAVWCCHSSGAV